MPTAFLHGGKGGLVSGFMHFVGEFEFMRRIQCRICRGWFEQNGTGICSDQCVQRAKLHQVTFTPKPLDKSWNEKLKVEAQKRAQAKAMVQKARAQLMRRAKGFKPKPLPPKPAPSPPRMNSKRKLKRKIAELQQKVKELQRGPQKAPTFYDSREWKELRYAAIVKYGRACMACRATTGVMHVDHIKPRSKFPHLALELSNLQILCADCNIGKSNKDSTDWRDR